MPHSGQLGFCVPIGGMPSPFWSGGRPLSYQAVNVPVLGAQDTHNRVNSGSGMPHFCLAGTTFVQNQIISRPSVHWLLLLHRDDSPGSINLVPVRLILMFLLAFV